MEKSKWLQQFRQRSFFLFLAITGAVHHNVAAQAIDSDSDGLKDVIEIQYGLDPNSVDSDIDGISDFDEFEAASSDWNTLNKRSLDFFSLSSSQIPDAIDSDGDGLNDFFEAYGFYIVDNTPAFAPRRSSVTEWEALKSNPLQVEGVFVFETALTRLEQDYRVSVDPSDNNYLLLNLDGAKNTIAAAYLDAGFNTTSLFIEGHSGHIGSAANIVKTLLDTPVAVPTDASGNPLEVYYTHPLKVSTDHDPYTDYDEAVGIFPAGRPLTPADHPLIAAAPAIKATLKEFEINLLELNSIAHGDQETELVGKRQSQKRSHSHGFSIGFKTEYEHAIGTQTGHKVKFGLETKHSSSWSFSSGTTLEQRNSHTTYSENRTRTDTGCFAKLDMYLEIENTGYANAGNISLTFNVYLGDAEAPWRTISVGSGELNNLVLSPQQNVPLDVLGGTAEACLTLEDTNYMVQGGVVSIETIVADATVDFYNQGSGIVEQGGSWQIYNNLIRQDLASLAIDVNATNGKQIDHLIYYVARDDGYPYLNLSVEEALATAFTPKTCDAAYGESRCYITETGDDIVLGDNTYTNLVFYDNQGVALPAFDTLDKYDQLEPLDNDDPFAKLLPRKTLLSIVNNDYEVPQFTHIEALNHVHSSGNTQIDTEIRAAAHDFFGIADVFFCFQAGNCREMDLINESDEFTNFSGAYRIYLPDYTLTGSEYIYARNSIGNFSPDQSPLRFFMLMHQSTNERLVGYADYIDTLQARINTLSLLQVNSPAQYAKYIEQGLLTPVGAAQDALDALKITLETVDSACTLSLGASSGEDRVAELQEARGACLKAFDELKEDIDSLDIKAFDIHKLPGNYFYERYLGATKAGENFPPSYLGSGRERVCKLDANQFATGIGMAKKDDKSTAPYIQLHYVEFDPVSRELKGPLQKICGSSYVEKQNILAVNNEDLEAEIILDVGISQSDNIPPGANPGNKNRRSISNLCVSYRKFNFGMAQWIGDTQIKCNNLLANSFSGVEAQTGNAGKALRGLKVYTNEAKTRSDVRGVIGYHSELAGTYHAEPYENLSEFVDYKIVNMSTGELLTITSESQNSAAIDMEPDQFDRRQLWKIQRVNDREIRLIPKTYPDGVFVRNPGAPSVAKLMSDDGNSANYAQHLIISQQAATSGAPYLIRSVLDQSYLVHDNELAWRLTPSSSEQWMFVPATEVPAVEHPQEQTFNLTDFTHSTGAHQSCQTFDLGGEYFIKQIKLTGNQDAKHTVPSLLISLNATQEVLKKYSDHGPFSHSETFNSLRGKSASIKICDPQILKLGFDGIKDNLDLHSIEVTAIAGNLAEKLSTNLSVYRGDGFTEVQRLAYTGQHFEQTPLVFGAIQTMKGPDPAHFKVDHVVEADNLFRHSVFVRIQEEQSHDNEIGHAEETVGILSLPGGTFRNLSGEVIGESGLVNVNQPNHNVWHTLNFSRNYVNPVVIMMIQSSPVVEPAHIRVRQVGTNQAIYQIEEWHYQDGERSEENVAYLVVEAGTHVLANNRKMRVFTTTSDHSWGSAVWFPGVWLNEAFNTEPVVLTQTQSWHGPDAVVTRLSNVTKSKFQVRLQEEEASDGWHTTETIGVIAIEQ